MPITRSASTDYPGDGVTELRDFSFEDGYLDRSFVKCKIINDTTKAETPYPLTDASWEGPYRLRITPAAQVGYTTRIYRDTPAVGLIDWATRARVDRDGLALTLRQPLHVAAENSENQQFAIDAGEAAAAAAAAAAASAESIEGDAAAAAASATSAGVSAAAAATARAAVEVIYADLLDNPPADAGITAVLTRDSAIVPADVDGNVSDFATANGKMNVYDGNTLVSDGLVTYSVQAQVGCTVNITSTGQYTVTAMSSDYASATFRATYGGVNRDKRFGIAKARSGFAGDDGDDGLPGNNSATINIYQRSQTEPAKPTGTQTYTFLTTALSGLNGGWTRFPPAGSDPLWIAAASFVGTGATDTCLGSEWSSPIQLVEDGKDGFNVATIFLFQRTATATPPSLPSASVTYTFATGTATGVNNGWTQSMPATGGGYRWITTATAANTAATDTVGAGEWATAQLIAQDGENGQAGLNTAVLNLYKRSVSAPSGLSGTVTYTFSTAVASGLTNGWTQTIPAGTDPIWCISGSAVSAGTTDTITAGEFTTAIKLAESGTGGADGINTAVVFMFQRTSTATPPSKPSADVTYTFATGVATGQNNGWQQTLPVGGGQYAWLTTATAASQSATDTIPTTEWATVAALAIDGAAGQNAATVVIYRRSPTSPALPTATVTYTFATGVLSGLNNGWSTTIPGGTDPLWASSVAFVSSGATDTATAGEWAAVVKLVENGNNGLNSAVVFLYRRTGTNVAPALPTSTTTYTFATGIATGMNNGWTQGIPDDVNGPYLWVTTASVISTGPDDTVAPGEWATVRLMAADGQDGNDGIDAKALGLFCTTQMFTFAADNVTPLPAGQLLTATLVLNNISGTATWTCTLYNSSGTSLGTVTMGGSGNTRTLSVAQFGTAYYAEIVASLSGYTDMARIIRLRDGSDGSSPVASDLDNDSHTLSADSGGQVISYTGAQTRMRVYVGLADDSVNWTFTRTATAGLTANLGVGADKNLLTLTAMANDVDTGYVDIVATRSGYPTQTKRFTVAKARSAPGSNGLLLGSVFGSFDMSLMLVDDVSAYVTLQTDGNVTRKAGNTPVSDKDWYSPPTAGIGSSYWVRATISGDAAAHVVGPTSGVWLPMSTSRQWSLSVPNNTNDERDADVNLVFATDSGGVNVLGTMKINLGAHRPQ